MIIPKIWTPGTRITRQENVIWFRLITKTISFEGLPVRTDLKILYGRVCPDWHTLLRIRGDSGALRAHIPPTDYGFRRVLSDQVEVCPYGSDHPLNH